MNGKMVYLFAAALALLGGCIHIHPSSDERLEIRRIDARTCDMARTLRYIDARIDGVAKRLDRIEGIEEVLKRNNKEESK